GRNEQGERHERAGRARQGESKSAKNEEQRKSDARPDGEPGAMSDTPLKFRISGGSVRRDARGSCPSPMSGPVAVLAGAQSPQRSGLRKADAFQQKGQGTDRCDGREQEGPAEHGLGELQTRRPRDGAPDRERAF